MTESILAGKRFVSPETVVSHFHVREGDSVADYGAGAGFYVQLLSKKVGQTGTVYACEIQKELVERIGTITRTNGIHNVRPLWCDVEMEKGSKIPDGVIDIGLLINTLFQLQEKEIALREIARTIRSGGKLYVVEWSDSFGGLGPQPSEIISLQQTQALCEGCGFIYENEFDAGDHHYGVSFRKI